MENDSVPQQPFMLKPEGKQRRGDQEKDYREPSWDKLQQFTGEIKKNILNVAKIYVMWRPMVSIQSTAHIQKIIWLNQSIDELPVGT